MHPHKILPLLTLLSLAAPGCLPEGDGSSSGAASTSPPDVLVDGVEPFDLPANARCAGDVNCARFLVCENYRCTTRICTDGTQCGEDNDDRNTRGCHLGRGRCTAGECVEAVPDFCGGGVACVWDVCQAEVPDQ